MILDSLSSSTRYERLSPAFARAFAWLRSVDPSTLPDGKTILDGDLFVLVHRGLSQPLAQVKWEAHRKYADIQYVASGAETIFWEALERTAPGEYLADKDYVPIQSDTGTELTVSAGRFAVFFPEDAHRPGVLIPGSEPVVKLVVKVRV